MRKWGSAFLAALSVPSNTSSVTPIQPPAIKQADRANLGHTRACALLGEVHYSAWPSQSSKLTSTVKTAEAVTDMTIIARHPQRPPRGRIVSRRRFCDNDYLCPEWATASPMNTPTTKPVSFEVSSR